jgi:hypothetical protein
MDGGAQHEPAGVVERHQLGAAVERQRLGAREAHLGEDPRRGRIGPEVLDRGRRWEQRDRRVAVNCDQRDPTDQHRRECRRERGPGTDSRPDPVTDRAGAPLIEMWVADMSRATSGCSKHRLARRAA